VKTGKISSEVVILTCGTYMKARTFSGFKFDEHGPIFDYENQKKEILTEVSPRSNFLSDKLKEYGFELIRLKTGTPPRVYKDSIDFSNLEIQPGTNKKLSFEFYKPTFLPFEKQVVCYMTYTNDKTHKIIRDNIKLSPMFMGMVKSIGPRYCPSIEDKVFRFSDKPRHQLFIEPESLLMKTIYLQGFSTALPEEVQDKMIRTLPGFEKCRVQRYAYAIEYDAIVPTQLLPTLESKKIKNLFFAGQLNGTSGYEEAAGQGMLAGINAARKIKGIKPLILSRNESYIGVMVDDITTKGVSDPYRLLTSRAEYRLFLRNDNADERLTKYGYETGTIKKDRYNFFLKQQKKVVEILSFLKTTPLNKTLLKQYGSSCHNLYQLLKRPEVELTFILKKINKYLDISENILEKVNIKIKYEGYLIGQEKSVKQYNKMQDITLECINDYKKVNNLSLEAIDKLNKIKPFSLRQAQMIQGITSSDIIRIKYYLETIKKKNK